MALVKTLTEFGVQGNKRIVYGTLQFDASYVTGGMPLTPRDLGLTSITRLLLDGVKGFDLTYIAASNVLQCFYGSQSALLSSQSSAAGVGNAADTTDDTLFTFSVPIATLNANGKSIRLTAWGATAANANNKRIRAVLDAAALSTGTVAWNNQTWWLDAHFIRVDATHINAVLQVSSTTGAVSASSLNGVIANMGTNALALTVTGASQTTGAASDVVGHGFVAEILGVAGAGSGVEVPAGTDLSGLTLNFLCEGF